jgi:hypothetical protein
MWHRDERPTTAVKPLHARADVSRGYWSAPRSGWPIQWVLVRSTLVLTYPVGIRPLHARAVLSHVYCSSPRSGWHMPWRLALSKLRLISPMEIGPLRARADVSRWYFWTVESGELSDPDAVAKSWVRMFPEWHFSRADCLRECHYHIQREGYGFSPLN